MLVQNVTVEEGEEGSWGHLAIRPVITVIIVVVTGTSLYPLLCFGAPNPSPRFGVFLERVPAKIYYSEGIQSKMSEGQRHVG